MDKTSFELIKALEEERPTVLFLGQKISSSLKPDPVLTSFLDRLGNSTSRQPKWLDLFGSKALTGEDFEWLAERFQRNVEPQSFDEIFEIAWSGVFTSSIDPKILVKLESRGRVPEGVLAQDHFSRVPRSRSRPAVHYLLGKANETDANFRPPRSKMELRQRVALHANQLLTRIPDTVTPLGLLVVDGYESGSDWLNVDDFLAPLSQASGLKILWLGAEEDPDSEFYAELLARGNITRDKRSLAEIVAEINATASDKVLGAVFTGEVGTISLRDGTFLQISPSMRLRVEASAAIVDDTWTDPQAPLTGIEEADTFRRFHGDLVGARGLIEGVSRGYAIERDFEHELFNSVERTLNNQGNIESFAIVHGQSGVGKSIALARLASGLRNRLKIPVLFAWGRLPAATDLDDFCAECEKGGAIATVIICDANQSFERYRELANALRSRGRRIVVVGSSYMIEDVKLSGDSRFVRAKATVSEIELKKLRTLLSYYGARDNGTIDTALAGDHVLALLYRHLSVSRSRIIGGIADEARFAESTIRGRAQTTPKQKIARTNLAQKLIDAGIGDIQTDLFEEDISGATLGSDAAGRLINYVMVAGRLDCAVPVNLVLRALRTSEADLDLGQISHLFGELDLFRWRMADAEGNDLLIQPRLQLEAELICRSRLADRNKEIDCIVELIEAVRVTGVDRKSEILFLLDLLHKLNRDGPRGNAYKTGFLRIGNSLTQLRITHHVLDASLMLQESAFRRHAVVAADTSDGILNEEINEEERDQILNEAREVVELALSQISEEKLRAGRKTKQNFMVERASIYGFLAVGLAKRNADEEKVWSNYLAARTAISKAMSVSENYFPQDIGIWTPADILKYSNVSAEHHAELRADIFSIFDHVNTDLMPTLAAEKFNTRRMRVAEVLENTDLADEAFLALERTNPAVAYYLKARSMCPEIFSELEDPFDEQTRLRAKAAAAFLFEKLPKVQSDTRCLQLLLQCRWIAETGTRILRVERCLLPSDTVFQGEILGIVSALNRAAGEGARNIYRFLEASLEWVRGDLTVSRDLFKALAHDTEFEDPSRVVRRLLLAPNKDLGFFRGRVIKQRSEGHWSISVEGLQGTVDLLARDFSGDDLRLGREVRRFNIAFNYLGPIADPQSKHGVRI